MIYAVIINTNTCLIYSYQKKTSQIHFVNEIIHPESRLKASEYLTTEKPGRYKNRDTSHGAYEPRTSPKETEYVNFAREIAKILNEARMQHEYQQLVIIAEPHMQGLLGQHLDKNVQSLVAKTIEKDIVKYNEKKIVDFLKNELQFISSVID